ncbi:MAG: ABC transporter ATP-binding protein [Thermoanaerobacterales bacterium]|jgi:putative ABC transport system ATP-binding protein|nr:ABC transporter ATP-binding protein [Thermoanaerobacterales bacterium]
MPALVMEGVRKVYRSGSEEVVALDHADLVVGDDEMVTLLGPSGSGKTTLLSIAGGLLTPTEGRVVVGDQVVSDLDPRQLTAFRQRQVGFVFQSVNLVPFLTARENLTVVGELAGRPRRETGEQADRLLEELGLSHRAGNLATELSGGERQRVAIGRALMNDPKLVLVDEPTSALDTKMGEAVMELLRNEITGRGIAAVVVTHDTRMTHYTDRTVEIVDGRLQA